MKKLLIAVICVITTFCNVSLLHAEENTQEPTENYLDQIEKSDIIIGSYYNDCMFQYRNGEIIFLPEYKDVVVLYQQGTGIQTLDDLYFNVTVGDKKLFERVRCKDGFAKYTNNENFKVSSKVISNPAENPDFINTPQDFEIKVEITFTDGQTEKKIEKSVPARVVKVEGTIINRSSFENYEISTYYDEDISSIIHGLHENYKVRLLNGTVIDVDGISGQGGGTGGMGMFGMGLDGPYELQYIVEGAFNNMIATRIKGYLVDRDGNLVNQDGTIVVPIEERETVKYQTSVPEIELYALKGTLGDNVKLVATKIENLNLDQPYIAYDMNIMSNDFVVQPKGSIEIAIAIPDHLIGKDIIVYYLNEDGKFEEIKSVKIGNNMLFDTNHLSTYVLTEKIQDATNQQDENEKQPEIGKDDTVIKNTSSLQTGDATNTQHLIFLSFVMLLAIISGMLIKRKRSNS